MSLYESKDDFSFKSLFCLSNSSWALRIMYSFLRLLSSRQFWKDKIKNWYWKKLELPVDMFRWYIKEYVCSPRSSIFYAILCSVVKSHRSKPSLWNASFPKFFLIIRERFSMGTIAIWILQKEYLLPPSKIFCSRWNAKRCSHLVFLVSGCGSGRGWSWVDCRSSRRVSGGWGACQVEMRHWVWRRHLRQGSHRRRPRRRGRDDGWVMLIIHARSLSLSRDRHGSVV